MDPHRSKEEELRRREEAIKEREIQIRMHELEAELDPTSVTPTTKHPVTTSLTSKIPLSKTFCATSPRFGLGPF